MNLLSIQEPEDPSNPIIDKGTGIQMTVMNQDDRKFMMQT